MPIDSEITIRHGRDVAVLPAPQQHATRIVIAGNDVLLRTGLAALLEQRPGLLVVGTVGDTTELLGLVDRLGPDLVVVDAGVPSTCGTDGLEAAARVRAAHPGMPIVVLASHVDHGTSVGLPADGDGFGYLLRHRLVDVDDFVDTLGRVLRGGCVLDPALVHELMRQRHQVDPVARLSRREHDVLELMAQGRSNLGIARELWLAEGTVEMHVRSILTKLGLCDTPVDHRRVLAVIAFLRSDGVGSQRCGALEDASV